MMTRTIAAKEKKERIIAKIAIYVQENSAVCIYQVSRDLKLKPSYVKKCLDEMSEKKVLKKIKPGLWAYNDAKVPEEKQGKREKRLKEIKDYLNKNGSATAQELSDTGLFKVCKDQLRHDLKFLESQGVVTCINVVNFVINKKEDV